MSPAALLKFRPAVEWVRALLIRRVISTLLSFRAITLPGSNNYTEVCLVGFAGWSTYARPRRLFFSFISPRLRIKQTQRVSKSGFFIILIKGKDWQSFRHFYLFILTVVSPASVKISIGQHLKCHFWNLSSRTRITRKTGLRSKTLSAACTCVLVSLVLLLQTVWRHHQDAVQWILWESIWQIFSSSFPFSLSLSSFLRLKVHPSSTDQHVP